MTKGPGSSPVLRGLTRRFSIINVLLALNYFPLVPLLGWLNFGRAGRAEHPVSLLLEGVLFVLIPAGAYYFYWHYWFMAAGPALVLSLLWWRQGGTREARVWTLLNGATLAMYLAIRIILAVQGIRPDIV